MKQKVTSILLASILILTLTACGGSAAKWQEQYDLGVRYLSDSNYEEAIIAFTAAIKIDPKNVEAYKSLAEVYLAIGDIEQARLTLVAALDETGDESLQDFIDALQVESQQEPAIQPEQQSSGSEPKNPSEENAKAKTENSDLASGTLSDSDKQQMIDAVNFYLLHVEFSFWNIYDLFGYDAGEPFNEIYIRHKIKGNPSYEEIEAAVIDAASEYLTSELIQSSIHGLQDSIMTEDGITYFLIGGIGTPEVANDSFEFSIENESVIASYNYWEKSAIPDGTATFVKRDGKLLLANIAP